MSKAVVFAYSSVGCECLSVLLRRGVDIALVYTHQDDPNEERWFDSVYDLARSHGLTVLTEEPSVERVREAAPDVIFSFYYRSMLPMSILNLAPLGAFNMHGSLLPRYRGRACVNWAVLNGETETGVTLHHMTEYADRGNIVAQRAVTIGPDETAHDVFLKIIPAAGEVLSSSLDAILSGSAPGVPQDESKATKYGRRRPSDGLIDWTMGAEAIACRVRGFNPWPGTFTYLPDGGVMKLWLAQAVQADKAGRPGEVIEASAKKGLFIACGEGALEVLEMQAPGSKRMNAKAYLMGKPLPVGTIFSRERD